MNAWLVRAAASAVHTAGPAPGARGRRTKGLAVTGWAR